MYKSMVLSSALSYRIKDYFFFRIGSSHPEKMLLFGIVTLKLGFEKKRSFWQSICFLAKHTFCWVSLSDFAERFGWAISKSLSEMSKSLSEFAQRNSAKLSDDDDDVSSTTYKHTYGDRPFVCVNDLQLFWKLSIDFSPNSFEAKGF